MVSGRASLFLFFLWPCPPPPRSRATQGHIIGGREARPHYRPYMAFILIQTPVDLTFRLSFLCSQINVILGAHNVKTLEGTQQRIPVLRPVPHPGYSPQSHSNDIMLLQAGDPVHRGRWGLTGLNTRTDTLQSVQLSVQRDRMCSRRFISYNGGTQICVGDPRQRKSAFVGIVSYGDRMRTPPAVFTRNSSFLPWIRRTMRRFKEWRSE
ncbi:hypothetical protein FD755_019315 [Muntiacus reevesi]|uniref:Peptidase S1 domain-containing protein n=1 Tax=Muntiacus reevesi TaxID=9886 RepID=A0A5N3X555_MUNRE|nr:hypothetical protein FD755_019315 [Muntiacus reevesi]